VQNAAMDSGLAFGFVTEALMSAQTEGVDCRDFGLQDRAYELIAASRYDTLLVTRDLLLAQVMVGGPTPDR